MLLAAGDFLVLTTLGLLALAATGTALGSVMRDALVRRFRARWQRADLGILAANLAACALAGTVLVPAGPWREFLVIGLAGGLSTWSSLAVEVAGAMRARRWSLVLMHVPGAFAIALGVYIATRALAGGAP